MKTDNITYEPKDSPLVGTLITDDDGVQMKVADMQTWTETLKKAYPDGLVIKMPNESLAHLLDMKEALEEGREHLLDEVTFAGQIDKENPHIIPEGELKAELRLPTEMYYRITPDEMRYPLDAPEAEWMEWEDRACTRLLHEHQDNLQGAYVEVTIREEVMPFLHIEGQPYPKVMDVIERTGVTTESDLKQLLNLQNLYENGIPEDNSIPECLKDLMEPVTEKYKDLQDTPENRTQMNIDLMNRVELLLKRCWAVPTNWHNLVGTFDNRDNNAAARQIVGEMNRRFAPDIAFAVRHDNKVEVSIRSLKPLDQMNIKDMFRCDPECTELKEQPFHNLELATEAYLFCKNGQILEGHIGVEGLDTKYQYGLSDLSEDKKTFKTLLAEAERSHPENTFSTDVQIKRFRCTFKGQMMPIAHMMNLSQFEKQQTVQNFTFAHTDERNDVEGPVWLTGKIGGETVVPRQLNEEDTKLFYRYKKQFMTQSNINVVKGIFCEAYYKDELNQAWEKELTFRQQLVDKRLEKERLYHRITHATLYGKVDNVHVRCKIDGVQQMGRPITPEDAKRYAGWKEDARLLGKDTLNYKTWLHEDYIKQIAANAFSDVLNRATGQEKQQSMKR